MRTYGLSDDQQDLMWGSLRAGESVRSIARHQRVPLQHVQRYFRQTGGVRPAPRNRSARHLSAAEREEISRGIAAGESARVIAARLGRAPATISREIARNGGRVTYRARTADDAAFARARRPKVSLLAARPVLRARVDGLGAGVVAQQISRRLWRELEVIVGSCARVSLATPRLVAEGAALGRRCGRGTGRRRRSLERWALEVVSVGPLR